jgi:hypothetical protein
MRIAVLACAVLAGCVARSPDLPVPSPEPGSLRVRAVAAARLGSVQPSAGGAALGAVTGVLGGARDGNAGRAAEVGDRALAETTLANGFSATGYVYHPAATYPSLELFAVEDAGTVVHTRVPVE